MRFVLTKESICLLKKLHQVLWGDNHRKHMIASLVHLRYEAPREQLSRDTDPGDGARGYVRR